MQQRKAIRLPDEITLQQLLNWGSRFDTCMLLDSNSGNTGQKDPLHAFDFCLATGSISNIEARVAPFENLYRFHQDCNDWIFGHFSYDLKNTNYKLHSDHPDHIHFPLLHFFQPRYVFLSNDDCIHLYYHTDHDDEKSAHIIIEKLLTQAPTASIKAAAINLQQRMTKAAYLESAKKMLQHIQLGDIYEANFCMEFYEENVIVDAPGLFTKLNSISPMPFAAFYRLKDHYLLCASPERFLAKRGDRLISQPIKGTARRGATEAEDNEIAAGLLNDRKELSENIMITDLVRNDLSITALRGSVQVEELTALKTYPRVHQLVTTISSRLDSRFNWCDAIKSSFPMGSMTGAPKLRAMQIIEDLEKTRRGLYSGSVGYVTPEGDFDFNVVIRSIQYNQSTGYISAMVGSALTAGCDPEKEYDECLLKLSTMRKALE